ncbi:nuclear transport factor 2 family protein [Nocardiopsis alkaliphila]|uniref:nuclear transport factor 2 family protein n=1 Tax=Nocardiopsis alkaliphila TaxID=225762 RepID=UPI0003448D53|nr:nuclear transport factor 2 family protein [Nocardiopsis alkaliphila]
MHEEAAPLRSLLDRAAIDDLLTEFVHRLDERDFTGYAALFTEDAALRMPGAEHHGRAGLAEYVSADLGRYHRTHHLSTAHRIRIDGDHATSRSVMHAVHLRGADDPTDWWAVGGWYDNTYRRVGSGWLIHTVDITALWLGEGA